MGRSTSGNRGRDPGRTRGFTKLCCIGSDLAPSTPAVYVQKHQACITISRLSIFHFDFSIALDKIACPWVFYGGRGNSHNGSYNGSHNSQAGQSESSSIDIAGSRYMNVDLMSPLTAVLILRSCHHLIGIKEG